MLRNSSAGHQPVSLVANEWSSRGGEHELASWRSVSVIDMGEVSLFLSPATDKHPRARSRAACRTSPVNNKGPVDQIVASSGRCRLVLVHFHENRKIVLEYRFVMIGEVK